MAERLVTNQDLAEAEVMLEVEVLEVGTNVLQELGIRYPEQFSYSIIGSGGIPGTVTLPEWQSRDSNLVRLTVSNPFLIVNLKNQTGQSNVLANPRIRVKSKDKAKIHIGEKVPVITNTSTSTGFVAESVNYLDVGLKLDVEPTVTLDDEVGIKMGLEVSNIVREIRSTAGTLTYQLGTRNATTTLRLKDGETQVLAGLISDEDRKTANQIPGLGELPVIGRLFGSHADTTARTEIVLLITPRIVRNIARPDVRFEEFASGTEGAIGSPALVLQPAAHK
jgi:general secretion pathway protein D